LSTLRVNKIEDVARTVEFDVTQGSAGLPYVPSGTNAIATNVQAKLRESVSVKDFGAVGDGVADDTAAFVAAYNAHEYVYLPSGRYVTSTFYPDRSFGMGEVFSDNASFTDSGERPYMKGFPTKGGEFDRVKTYGNFERASGQSLIVNNETGRVQVSGYSSDSEVALYQNRDHVGQYIGMYGPRNQVLTTAGSTTYTETTVSAPEITTGANIQIGMFVDTGHSPKYSGKVTNINFGTNTLAVSGWFQVGNTSAGQVPANGFSARINPADKIWGQNTNVYIDNNSTAKTATGYELGLFSNGTHNIPMWGYHAVNLSNVGAKFDKAFYATGQWKVGYEATSAVDIGLFHNKPPTAGVNCENLDDAAWAGAVVRLNTSHLSTGNLLNIVSGGATQWSVNSRGHRSTQREALLVVAANANLSLTGASIVAGTNSTNITINLPEGAVAGHVIEVRKFGAGDITINYLSVTRATLNSTNGVYTKLVFDGSTFLRLFYAN
jgi:hypothetical protein